MITGVGSYLPINKCSNENLSNFVDTSDEWISKRSGIKYRHFVSDNENTSDMAFFAAKKAIENASQKALVFDPEMFQTHPWGPNWHRHPQMLPIPLF